MTDLVIDAIRLDRYNPLHIEAARVETYLVDVSMVLNWLEKPTNRAFVKRYDGDPIEIGLRTNPNSSIGPSRWLVTVPDEQFLTELHSVTRC